MTMHTRLLFRRAQLGKVANVTRDARSARAALGAIRHARCCSSSSHQQTLSLTQQFVAVPRGRGALCRM
jgi:hypothetical protein